MAHRGGVASQRPAGAERLEADTLELIREKERELTELVLAARREAEEIVRDGRGRAESLLANAAAEATEQADAYLRSELDKADQEAETILAQSVAEVKTLQVAARERMPEAVDFVTGSVIPGLTGEGEP